MTAGRDGGAAPGWPGSPPRWTSSAKAGVGTSLSNASRVWFTISHGVFNEVYYPRIDQPCVRDMGLVVTGGAGYFSDEKRHARCSLSRLAPGVPAFRLENRSLDGRYVIVKEALTDPAREVLLQKTRFEAAAGTGDYRVSVVLAPHLANAGWGNTGWTGEYKGVPMLFARREGVALALACSSGWLGRSAGFVGASDGWRDLAEHGRLTCRCERAENGNIALTGEIDLSTGGEFTLALAFGRTAAEAGNRALASLMDGFESAKAAYLQGWQAWQRSLLPLSPGEGGGPDLYAASTAVLRTHEAKDFPGGVIASLSLPWGNARSDGDLGGYHLVWPRDLAETAAGLLAAGAHEDARRVLRYLQSTQEPDGHWPQNMWLDGSPYWSGVQLDETALPVMVVDLARRENAVDAAELASLWPMVKRAAAFLVRNGPVTQQDRWEEDPGYSPFTIAAEIAALLCAADLADLAGESPLAAYLRETADFWNSSIEQWLYVKGTRLARAAGVDGYYVRIAPPETSDAASPAGGFVSIKNRPPGESPMLSSEIVSPDALALVRFGLRAADDPRILNTVRVIDFALKAEGPGGPLWHRYSGDGYGEHSDGSPFDGTGIGRAWPLITGERAHYELAAGRPARARRLLGAFAACANGGGLLPEQVWDAPDIPERELYFGRPSGSAMPLVWAHAEYVSLLRSLRDGRVFGMPPQPARRYQRDRRGSAFSVWRRNHKIRALKAGRTFRVELAGPAVIHWSGDGWKTVRDTETRDTGCGVHLADLPAGELPPSGAVVFTIYWKDSGTWEGADYTVRVPGTGEPGT